MQNPQYIVKQATKDAITAAIPQLQALYDAIGIDPISPGTHFHDAHHKAFYLLETLKFLKNRTHVLDANGNPQPPIEQEHVDGGIAWSPTALNLK